MNPLTRIRQAYDGMPHRRRQFLNLGAIVGAGVGALWFVFSIGQTQQVVSQAHKSNKAVPDNLGIQVAGEIDPRDAWLGTAGRDVAQLKVDVEEQQRKDRERKATEDALTKRLAELEQRAEAETAQRAAAAQTTQPSPPEPQAPAAPTTSSAPTVYPPATPLTVGGTSTSPRGASAGKEWPALGAGEPDAPIIRVSLVPAGKSDTHNPGASAGGQSTSTDHGGNENTVESFLPVSFTSGVLLGGIDAPTGGQAQSNPLPILVRLTDNAVLPNKYRADVKNCFVIASGYGDISSERVYARTVNLSCVRRNGTTLELPIQGNLYGEDGKLGLRGRLVTKQGQILANALRAGIVGGIGQGFAQSGTSYSMSPFGTLATNSGGTGQLLRQGMAGGMGRALDNLANYYIRLAEQTFPVVEVDAGRATEVAITKGTSMPAASGHKELAEASGGYDEDD